MIRALFVTLASIAVHLWAPGSASGGEPGATTRTLYWTDRTLGAVLRAPASGDGAPQVIVQGLPSPQGICVDPVRGYVYWADTTDRAVFRCDLDGSNPVLLHASQGFPKGLAIDAVSGWLAFADPALRLVSLIDPATGDTETVVSTATPPQDVALDGRSGRVIWLEASVGLSSASLDGDDQRLITPSFPGQATVVALADDRATLYWGAAQKLRSIGTFGGCAEQYDPPVSDLKGIAFDAVQQRLYWVDEDGGRILASTDGGEDLRTVYEGLPEPWRLAIGPWAAAPSIAQQPESVIADERDSVSLKVVAAGTGPFAYTWFRGGIELTDRGSYSGTATARLTLDGPEPSDVGSYTCRVTSPYGEVKSEPAVIAFRFSDPLGGSGE
ncbi:MAG: immunoglobulin domain-containing protein [Planctomycetota bacterium]